MRFLGVCEWCGISGWVASAILILACDERAVMPRCGWCLHGRAFFSFSRRFLFSVRALRLGNFKVKVKTRDEEEEGRNCSGLDVVFAGKNEVEGN